MRNRIWLAMPMMMAMAGCQAAEAPDQMQARMQQDSEELAQVARAVIQRWEAWTVAGQADSFSTVFTEQGREMPPHTPAVVGHQAIRAFHAQQAAGGSSAVDITSESVVAYGPLGIDRGTFTSTFEAGPNAPPGIPPADTGKYLVHWHKVGDAWLIAELIWNSDLPIAQLPRRRP